MRSGFAAGQAGGILSVRLPERSPEISSKGELEMMNKVMFAAGVAAFCLSCNATAQGQGAGQAVDPLAEMREVAAAMPPKMIKVLNDEIEKGGFASAISVCREKAPAMAKATSEAKSMQIRRVSLRNRSPNAVPDAWERQVLEDFDKRADAGESPGTLEVSKEFVEDGKRVVRYMKAVPTQAECLACHGTDKHMNEEARARIMELYPDDKATGFRPGQIRGAITMKKSI